MAVVFSALINALRTGYSREFETAKAKAPTQWASIATRVPSGNTSNTYGWLGQFPKLREWTGDRVFNSIKEYGYTVTNKLYEATVDIPRTALEDDELGTYTPLFQEMGYAAATHPDEIIFGLLKKGNTELCYDGKPFFTNDHPVYPNVDGTGTVQTISNLLAPSSSPSTSWYLLDVSRPLRPFIFQERTTPELQVATKGASDEMDRAALETAIICAGSEVDSYFSGRYAVPLADPIPPVVMMVTADIVRYRLTGGDVSEKELVVTRYKATVAWLRDVASGVVSLPCAGTSEETSDGVVIDPGQRDWTCRA